MAADPPPITEAAGLLRSGVIFPRRVGLQPVSDPAGEAAILLGFKRGGFSVYFGDAPLLHFDRDGRWQRAFIVGTHYLKGLDTQVQAVERVREGESLVLRRRILPVAEATALDATIRAQIETVRADLAAEQYRLLPPPPPSQPINAAELGAMLDRIIAWDAAAWDDHRTRHRQAYGDGFAPFLPPDCPNPVILQIQPAMAAAAGADHARAVAALFGTRLDGCRDVFLTGPGWLDRPEAEVLALLAAVAAVLPIQPAQARPRALDAGPDAPRLETIHGWLDAIPAPLPAADAWTRFRAAHLGRITLRVDGNDPPAVASLQPLIALLKTAGIGVGLAVFVDPARAPATELHSLLAALPLGSGDLIALVAAADADPAGLGPLKARLVAAFPPEPKPPRVVVYNPDKQWI